MTNAHAFDEYKIKLRSLKKLETKLRFGGGEPPRGARLVWDEFFSLREGGPGRARHTAAALAAMTKDAFRAAVDEYLFHLYFRIYRENGDIAAAGFDPEILAGFGLPFDADASAVKKRFRELALKYHPDMGGDAAEFVKLMENYRRLIDKGG